MATLFNTGFFHDSDSFKICRRFQTSSAFKIFDAYELIENFVFFSWIFYLKVLGGRGKMCHDGVPDDVLE